ncbi:hypothetical protein BT96DRAFT_996227 [Gymnopus androsaceus JB14]|uniref:CxC2-like cysteine cluster KDZ transposase-associated domain-containing protein n=1 Tax=Gymnopus androsaceus JB14 TaxID=1447944 RepID=A0A6A4HH42_9AGAR|nr:hypothetical protein BT96DRAFT_996227 [Gymnopus androsaceus JB14]
MPKKKKTRNVQTYVLPESDSDNSQDELSHKTPALQTVHFSHVNVTASTHQKHLNTTIPAEPAEPQEADDRTGSPPAFSVPMSGWTPVICSSVITNLGVVTYTFGDSDKKALRGRSLSGKGEEADEEESAGIKKDGSRNELALWRPELDLYLREVLRLEGRGIFGAGSQCSCGRIFAVDQLNRQHRCRDCFTLELLCQDCMNNRHAYTPFHRLEAWNGRFFEQWSLGETGLVLELGSHTKEKLCVMSEIAPLEKLTVIHTNGIHSITVRYCSCNLAVHRCEQLLWARLWPATVTNPQTAITFECLEHFQMLNLMMETSGTKFYETLECLTDNTGMRVPPSHLREFMRASREWRTVRLYKRQGRGNIPNGTENIGMGDLAVVCMACPYPGMNLPADYESAPESKSFIYKLFTAQDANMKCTRLNASSEERNPGFNQGGAFFVNQTDFMDHVREYDKKIPVTKPTCNDHKAWLRFFVLDTIVSVLDLLEIYVLANERCRNNNFSFNWAPGVGHTDAESPERAWAISNSLAGSTKKMGPGPHRDMLDEHFGDWNWRKTITLGEFHFYIVPTGPEEALENRPPLVQALKDLTNGLAKEDVKVESDAKKAWELDNRAPNPFIPKVRQEEALALKDLGQKGVKPTVSATALVSEGLDLEEVIWRYKWDSEHQSLHPTDLQKAPYFEAQREHIPHAKALRDQINSEPGSGAIWNIPLLLPSEVHTRDSTCSKVLLVCEWWLRHAACHDALELMHKNLLIRTGLIAYKIKYLHGQYDGTRSSQTVNSISDKIRACASRYRALFAVVEKYANQRDALDNARELDVTLSWIWTSGVDLDNDNEAMHDSLRIAWCKASAFSLFGSSSELWEGFKTLVLTSATGSNWTVANILTLIRNEWHCCSTRQQSTLQSWISSVKHHHFNPNWKKQKKQHGKGQQQQDQQSGSSSQPNNGKKHGS